jgi:MFS transporter, ACS family, tartrate transporter
MDDTIPGNARASTIHEEGDASALASAMSKAGWRLMPLLILAFVINGLDRTNVGFAALTMKQDLGLTATQFGYGAGLLFVTYCLLEILSNLAMYRFGASRWLARILVSWGILAAATGFVVGPTSFYVVRLLLGAAEAGFTRGFSAHVMVSK